MGPILVAGPRSGAGVLAAALRGQGYDVIVVVDGALADRAVRTVTPSLVIASAQLADTSAVELMASWKADPALQAIPVVITGHPDRIEALERGADDCLGRFFSVREITLRVAAILRRTARPPQAGMLWA